VLNAFATEEIDLAVGNAGHRSGLAAFSDVILVECKNWSNAVGSQEVTYFVSRLRQRGCTCGILIAMNGVTGDAADLTAAKFEIATALKEKIRVIVLKRQELEALRTQADFVNLLKRKTLELIAAGTTV
jgi:restriction endonuclease Mrr